DGGVERRQIHIAQRGFGNLAILVIASSLRRAITDVVLGTRHQAIRRGHIIALKALHDGGGKLRAEERGFAVALRHPSPAWVAGNIEHRRKRPLDAVSGGFTGSDLSRLTSQFRVEGGSLCQRDREHGAEAVYHIPPEDKRYPQPRLKHLL